MQLRQAAAVSRTLVGWLPCSGNYHLRMEDLGQSKALSSAAHRNRVDGRVTMPPRAQADRRYLSTHVLLTKLENAGVPSAM